MKTHMGCAACPHCASDPSTGRADAASANPLIICPSCQHPLWLASTAVTDFYFRFDRAGTDAYIDLLEQLDPDHHDMPRARAVLALGIAASHHGVDWHESGIHHLALRTGDSLDLVGVIMELEGEGFLDDPAVRRAVEQLTETPSLRHRLRPHPLRRFIHDFTRGARSSKRGVERLMDGPPPPPPPAPPPPHA